MARVFISYNHADRGQAERLARRLESEGVELWWDPNVRFGQRDLRTIDEELLRAEHIIVLWSAKSVSSSSVLDEADYAREENKLVPVMLEDVSLPPRFRRIEAARLIEDDLEKNADWPHFLAQVTGKAPPVAAEAPRKARFISFNRMSGPAVTTALMSISSVAAAAPATQFLFPGEDADRVLTQIANAAPALSGVAALMVLQQMWTRAKKG